MPKDDAKQLPLMTDNTGSDQTNTSVKPVTYELWGSRTTQELEFFAAGSADADQLALDAELIWTVTAPTRHEAMIKLHDFMDWPPYNPASNGQA